MSSLRTLGAITTAMLAAGVTRRYPFVRIDFGSGTVRYTNCPGGFVGDIDGTGGQTWSNSRALSVSEMAQGKAEHGEEVSTIALGNSDGFFTTRVRAKDARDVVVLIYIAWFDTSWNLVDKYMLAPAYIDAIDAQLTATLALKTLLINHGREVPTDRFYYSAFPTAPHEGDTFQYGKVTSKPAPVRATTGLSSTTAPGSGTQPPGGGNTSRGPIIPVAPTTATVVSRTGTSGGGGLQPTDPVLVTR